MRFRLPYALSRFWCERESPWGLTVLRIGTAASLLWYLLPRWPHAVELYSTAGDPFPLYRDPAWQPPVLTPETAVLLCTGLLLALVAMLVGWQARLSTLAALIALGWLGLLDLASTMGKHVALALHILLLLGLAPGLTPWSVDAWVRNGGQNSACPRVAVWPRRLVQILLCSVYLGAAMTKLRTPAFASGDLLTFALLDDVYGGRHLAHWLATQPHVPRLLSVLVILLELTFPVLVWVPRLRRIMVFAMVVLHLGMAATLHLGVFSPLMVVALTAFLDERDWPLASPAVSAGTVPSRQGLAAISLGLWCGVIALGAWAGLLWQQSISRLVPVADPQSPERIAAVELPRAEVETWLAGQTLPVEDYVHSVTLGTRVSGPAAFGSSRTFRRGETVYVLTQAIEPHPPLAIEGLLLDASGTEVARFQHPLPAAYRYAFGGFELTDALPPGEYRVIIQVGGYEAAQKPITLLP